MPLIIREILSILELSARIKDMKKVGMIMNRKNLVKSLFILALFFCTISTAWSRDVEEKEVQNMQSWQETFDISGKNKGKFNILVTASDLGGNTTVEGPFNLYIDPKSDLPVCGITNPTKNMRIAGNLNIVGTCIDDDAVDHVELILDGDNANPVRVNGKEFWSYYLDTNKLSEGLHTIKVVGYDINGVKGEPVETSWHLDRRLPVTNVKNLGMGTLVSKVVKLHGKITDGNGIKSFYYSTDNGKTFKEVKFFDIFKKKKEKQEREFKISIDTRKFPDGAAVIWFKAVDYQGSEGIYSFLYFIDNTAPEIKVVSPGANDVSYGKIAVTGYAKDGIGIKALSWEFGSQKGTFELVPGNPYWGKILDLSGIPEKSRKFSVTAVDTAGNVTTVSRNINIDEELDKPKVEIAYPNAETFVEITDSVFVRGIAHDEDGIASVKYKLDSGSWIEEKTTGVFCGELAKGSDLSAGRHTVTVVAKDGHGVEGNPFSVSFNARGKIPEFTDAKIGNQAVVNGMSVNQEGDANFQVTANSTLGLASVHFEARWGKDGFLEKNFTPNGALTQTVSLSMNEFPQGIVTIFATATDTAGRSRNYKSLINVTNLSEITAKNTKIEFPKGVVDKGMIIGNKDFPASCYLVGGKAKTAEIVPKSKFVNAQLDGNAVLLVPTEQEGVSEPFIVRVTTDKGIVCESEKLMITNGYSAPVVKIKDTDGRNAINIADGKAEISGTVSTSGVLEYLSYKIYGVRANIVGGVLTDVVPIPVAEAKEKQLEPSRNFSFTEEFGYGIYVIEVTAQNSGGLRSSEAIAFRNIPYLPKGSSVTPKAPVITWIDAEEVYYVAAYQGTLSRTFGYFKRNSMAEGNTQLTASITAGEKTYTSKTNVSKSKEISAYFALVGDEPFANGKIIELNRGQSKNLTVYMDSVLPNISVNYEITGAAVPGGQEKQTGAAVVTKAEGTRYKVSVPLSNLPVRMNNIKLVAKSGSVSKEFYAVIGTVRSPSEKIVKDALGVYVAERSESLYDKDSASYVMSVGDSIDFYPNVNGLAWTAELVNPVDGLEFSYTDKVASVKVKKDGIYQNVVVRVKDSNKTSYVSAGLRFIVDSGAPEVHIVSPEPDSWARNTIKISGTAADPNGVKNGEYSIDGQQTWKPLQMSLTGKNGIGATFSASADISSFEDGLVGIDVRVSDVAGNISYARTSVFKDTTPPEAKVIIPEDDAVVNGENLIAFKITDNGYFTKMAYVAPPTGSGGKVRTEIETEHTYALTYIGTKDRPIDDAMSFEFTDAAGNTFAMEAWRFMIDSQSDLPVTDIHLPLENEVITRDFTISGVVYDDDGESTVYYRIDKGEYTKLDEPCTSFAIDIPFSSMTDNEHTIYMYAVDINGIKGPVTERKIRVSTEEPKAAMETPGIDTANKGIITLTGIANDNNGIEKVLVSLDNGNSYNNAVGTEKWSYTFDSRAIPGGTNVVFIKVVDKYGIDALYSSLLNIDNECPEMVLDYPLDYSSTSGPLFFSGYAFDNVNITELFVSIRSLEGKTVPKSMQHINFDVDRIIAKDIDISSLDNGSYNVELTAVDKAANATHISRNIELNKHKPLAVVNILYPLNGEHKQGEFNIYGNAVADKPVESLALYIDNKLVSETTLTPSDYFKFNVTTEMIESGVHTYRVDAKVEGGSIISSRSQTVDYNSAGPWIKIDNFTYGDFAIDRPYVSGTTGYALDGDETEISRMNVKSVSKDQRAEIMEKKLKISAKKPQKVEISFDNGKTFELVSRGEKWMYRIENQDLAEGYHFMLVRATMKNGETAIERTIIQIDNTAPNIRLITPSQGGRYNQELTFSGLSSDTVGLKNVKLALRKGDKASYEVPSFIQGLYLDWHFWGATLFDIGVGLTFFDDAVKLQFQWGQFTQAQREMFSKSDYRYGGNNVMGIKILANIAQIPFSYFLGHDWEWLSSSVAVGAQFSRFDNSDNDNDAQILSALLAQIEFPKVKFPKMKMFSSFSAYTEFSLWFIPTDVSDIDVDSFVPQISEGIRVNVF